MGGEFIEFIDFQLIEDSDKPNCVGINLPL